MKTSDKAALFILAASLLVLPWYWVAPWALVVCLLPRAPRLRALATVAVMHALYLQLGHASLAAFPWRADAILERLDAVLFLGHSPTAWAARHGGEFFQFMYFAFLPFIYTAIILGCAFKEEEFLAGFAFTYAAGLACQILFPARGPVVFLGPSPQDAFFARAVAWCINFEGGPHAAFPSLHAAASAYVYLFERRHRPRLAAVYLPIVLLIIVSTVFVRYHYVVDLLAAVAIAWAAQGQGAVTVVKLAGFFKRRAFLADLRAPRLAQERVLKRLLLGLSRTAYGRELGSPVSYDEFRRKVPIVAYDELLPWIERQKSREDDSLVSEKVLFYEKTSGSSAASKYIPYTASLRRSFHNMFFLWLHDLILNGPRFETWRAYLGVSPCVKTETKTAQGVRIGLESDSDYVGGWLGALLKPFLVESPAHDPEIISVWSPASLRDLRPGQAPSLKLISCWAHAQSREAAEELRGRFPGVIVQGKGLLSTEAPVTIPWIAAEGYVPVLGEVFFEFEDGRGNIRLLHELEIGGEYSVIVSQAGGLSRYRTGDRVQVSHFYLNSPCLEFIGRADEVCDLVGEKLNAGFVASALRRLPLEGRFQKLAPHKSRYVLLLDKGSEELAAHLDELLQESFQYKNARMLGQLDAPKVIVRSDIQDAVDGWFAAHGIRSGTVKESALLRHPGLAESLC